jgi:hypothetical protein
MREGDSMEYSLTGKLAGEVALGAKGVGVKGGKSIAGSRTMKLAKRGGKLVITKEIASEESTSVGASVAYGAGKMTHDREQGTTGSRAVTITLDPDVKEFDVQFAAFGAAASEAEIAALAARWPKLVESTVQSGEMAGTTTGMGVGTVTLEITEQTAFEQGRSTSARGTSQTYTGSSTLGAHVKMGPLPKVGARSRMSPRTSARRTPTRTSRSRICRRRSSATASDSSPAAPSSPTMRSPSAGSA